MTVTYNDTTYFYTVNLQGDITGICDSTGTQEVAYTYDAWGNPLTTTTLANSEAAQDGGRFSVLTRVFEKGILG